MSEDTHCSNNSSKLIGPLREIPDHLREHFSLNGKIQIVDDFVDESNHIPEGIPVSDGRPHWTEEYIEECLSTFAPGKNFSKADQSFISYNWKTAEGMQHCFEDWGIRNLNVAVVGTLKPWIESLLYHMGNNIDVVEYNPPIYEGDKFSIKTYDQFVSEKKQYDVIVSYSSIEHSGLGRYGDPIDHDGDVKAVDDIYNKLKSRGLFILGVPIGPDCIVWNRHRIYGRIGIDRLLERFDHDNIISRHAIGSLHNMVDSKPPTHFIQPITVFLKSD